MPTQPARSTHAAHSRISGHRQSAVCFRLQGYGLFLFYPCSPLPCCGRCEATRARQSLLPCAHAWHTACTIRLCLRSGLAFYRIGKRLPQRHNHSSTLINLISRVVDAAACLTVPAFMPDAQAQPRVAHCHTEAAPLFQAAAFRTCTLTPRPCSWLCL